MSKIRSLTIVLPLVVYFAAAMPIRSDEIVSDEFSRARPGLRIELPRDHGAHPDFQTEWWYFTGQLAVGARDLFESPADFGFQLTFFRRSSPTRPAVSAWEEGFLAHTALSDIRSGLFLHEERSASGGLGIAGASTRDLDVWNRDWRAERVGERILIAFSVRHEEKQCSVRLVSDPHPPVIYQGENGFSPKSNCSGCASMYYSVAPLRLEGHIECDGKREQVRGVGWMDHEFMTNALTSDQIGWDWMSIILPDARTLTIFRIRRADGTFDSVYGMLADGESRRRLGGGDFRLTPGATWQSARSGGRYPIEWDLSIPSESLNLKVRALLEDQEIISPSDSGPIYWEGAIRAVDGSALGYLEMTGYAEPLRGVF